MALSFISFVRSLTSWPVPMACPPTFLTVSILRSNFWRASSSPVSMGSSTVRPSASRLPSCTSSSVARSLFFAAPA